MRHITDEELAAFEESGKYYWDIFSIRYHHPSEANGYT
jgi:hypothetical protein